MNRTRPRYHVTIVKFFSHATYRDDVAGILDTCSSSPFRYDASHYIDELTTTAHKTMQRVAVGTQESYAQAEAVRSNL